MQHKLIVSFRKEVVGIKLTPLAISRTIGNCKYYNDTLVNTLASLYHVLGLKNMRKLGKSTL